MLFCEKRVIYDTKPGGANKLPEENIYFGIGEKRMRRIAEDNEGSFALFTGNRFLIIRPLMEQYFMELAKKGGQADAENDTRR